MLAQQFEEILFNNNFSITRYAYEPRNHDWEKCYYFENTNCMVNIDVILDFDDYSKIGKIRIKKDKLIGDFDSLEIHESIFSKDVEECLLFLKRRNIIKID